MVLKFDCSGCECTECSSVFFLFSFSKIYLRYITRWQWQTYGKIILKVIRAT